MIEIDTAVKRYGSVTALDGVSLSVPRGALFGLVGTNGAGKTTLFRLLVGHERPDEGTVRVAGRDPAASTAVRSAVGYLPEHAEFAPALTGREVVRFHARQRDVDRSHRRERVDDVLRTVGLGDAADRRVGGYSNGMNRRLGLATLLVGAPDVLLLDEPTASLDPEGVETFHRLVERVHERTNVTVLVTSHVLSEVERLCDRVAVLDGGQLVDAGPVDELGGGEAVVRFTPGSEVTPDDVTAFVDGRPDVRLARATGDRYALLVPESAAFDSLAALQAALDVERFEVDRTGLREAFDRLVGDDGGAGDGRSIRDDGGVADV
jgi:Cu-processing system ATP-binding protein